LLNGRLADSRIGPVSEQQMFTLPRPDPGERMLIGARPCRTWRIFVPDEMSDAGKSHEQFSKDTSRLERCIGGDGGAIIPVPKRSEWSFFRVQTPHE
jgi:hypothetical protein